MTCPGRPGHWRTGEVSGAVPRASPVNPRALEETAGYVALRQYAWRAGGRVAGRGERGRRPNIQSMTVRVLQPGESLGLPRGSTAVCIPVSGSLDRSIAACGLWWEHAGARSGAGRGQAPRIRRSRGSCPSLTEHRLPDGVRIPRGPWPLRTRDSSALASGRHPSCWPATRSFPRLVRAAAEAGSLRHDGRDRSTLGNNAGLLSVPGPYEPLPGGGEPGAARARCRGALAAGGAPHAGGRVALRLAVARRARAGGAVRHRVRLAARGADRLLAALPAAMGS